MIDWPKIAIGVAIAGGLIWLFADIRADGACSEAQKNERKNNDAGDAADDARSNYDRCLDGGGLWNFGGGLALRRGD